MDALWTIEEALWLEGVAAYEQHMFPQAVMAFPPPVGLLHGEAIIDVLRDAPRWTAITMQDKRLVRLADTVVLAYVAVGSRDGETPYKAYCTSTYTHDDEWQLISHQQTPIND